MKKNFIIYVLAIIFLTLLANGCTGTKALRPSEANYDQRSGKLITQDEYTFSYKYYPAALEGPTVIYIPGMGGRSAYPGRGSGAYALAEPLNIMNINFLGFDCAGALSTGSLLQHVNNALKRSEGGSVYSPSVEGKESTAQNIVKNEIKTLIEFVVASPTHDAQKGIYLIGGSFGAAVALESVRYFPNRIKGVIFVSPATLPAWYGKDLQSEHPEFDIINDFKSLIKAFGSRPALAIGSDKDEIGLKLKGTTLDAAKFLKTKIGENVEVLEIDSSLHAKALIGGNRKTRDYIAQWLKLKIGIQ